MEISGTILMIVGMGVVFLALSLLAFIAWILERALRHEVKSKQEDRTPSMEAVIALALAYHTGQKGSIRIDRVDESVWMQQARVYE